MEHYSLDAFQEKVRVAYQTLERAERPGEAVREARQ
jgi:hypothetical protein